MRRGMIRMLKRKTLYIAGLAVIRYRHRRIRGHGRVYSAAMAVVDINDLFWQQLVYGRLS
jgi:hypothetical protein